MLKHDFKVKLSGKRLSYRKKKRKVFNKNFSSQ